MDSLGIFRACKSAFRARELAEWLAAERGSSIGRVLGRVGPRTLESQRPSWEARPRLGGRRGRGVGGNDPGFGRPAPPKNPLRSRCSASGVVPAHAFRIFQGGEP